MAERRVRCELLSRLSLLTGKNTSNFFNLKVKIHDESTVALIFCHIAAIRRKSEQASAALLVDKRNSRQAVRSACMLADRDCHLTLRHRRV
jgi:hypothetical protein